LVRRRRGKPNRFSSITPGGAQDSAEKDNRGNKPDNPDVEPSR
ncbi:unnamed protein product, partial [marine sediment metagenome]